MAHAEVSLNKFQLQSVQLHTGLTITDLQDRVQVGSFVRILISKRYRRSSSDIQYCQPLPLGADVALERGTIKPEEIPAYYVSLYRPNREKSSISGFTAEIIATQTGFIDRRFRCVDGSATTFMLRGHERINGVRTSIDVARRFTVFMSDPESRLYIATSPKVENVGRKVRTHFNPKDETFDPAREAKIREAKAMNRPYQGGSPGLIQQH